MVVSLLLSIIISFLTGFIGFIFSMNLGSNYDPLGSNSYFYVIIFFLCFISSILSFWGSLILFTIKKKQNGAQKD